MFLLLCVSAVNAFADEAAEAVIASRVEHSRQFGHVIGDVVEQRVLLELNGRRFEPAELPRAERHGMWLERRQSLIEPAADGRMWLVMRYQIINAPRTVLDVIVVPLELRDKRGGPNLKIDRWNLSVAPLIAQPDTLDANTAKPQPERRAPYIETASMKHRLWLAGVALLVTLLTWSAWMVWRWRRAASSLPFARALRELRATRADAPEAWQVLHRAFDRTAGCVVHSASIQQLFERAPQLTPLRAQIEAFYAQSSRLFFSDAAEQDAISLTSLCKDLRRIERRGAVP